MAQVSFGFGCGFEVDAVFYEAIVDGGPFNTNLLSRFTSPTP
jgi:hypothetical protein